MSTQRSSNRTALFDVLHSANPRESSYPGMEKVQERRRTGADTNYEHLRPLSISDVASSIIAAAKATSIGRTNLQNSLPQQ